jgi:hypothetical protein
MTAIRTWTYNFRLDLDFRRTMRHVSRLQRPGLRALLRRQAERRSAGTLSQLDPAAALARHTRTFYELDPVIGHWRRV